jgi:hypothetical protein
MIGHIPSSFAKIHTRPAQPMSRGTAEGLARGADGHRLECCARPKKKATCTHQQAKMINRSLACRNGHQEIRTTAPGLRGAPQRRRGGSSRMTRCDGDRVQPALLCLARTESDFITAAVCYDSSVLQGAHLVA